VVRIEDAIDINDVDRARACASLFEGWLSPCESDYTSTGNLMRRRIEGLAHQRIVRDWGRHSLLCRPSMDLYYCKSVYKTLLIYRTMDFVVETF